MAEHADSAPDGPAAEPIEAELVPEGGEAVPIEAELVPGSDQAPQARPLPALAAQDGGRLVGAGPVSLPATVAAATGGFLLGVVAFVLVRVLRRPSPRRLTRRRRRLAARRGGVDIQSTRSFLVDVHLLDRR